MHEQGNDLALRLKGIEEDIHFLRLDLKKYLPEEDIDTYLKLLEVVLEISDAVEKLGELANELEEWQGMLALQDYNLYRGM